MKDDHELEDLRAAVEWEPDLGLAPLTDDERVLVHERIDALASDRLSRSVRHREVLAAAARRLGRQVGRYEVTLANAEAHLERLAGALDPASLVPIALVPFRQARGLIRPAFRAALDRQRRADAPRP